MSQRKTSHGTQKERPTALAGAWDLDLYAEDGVPKQIYRDNAASFALFYGERFYLLGWHLSTGQQE